LLHSIYSTEYFEQGILPLADRDIVIRAVGPDIERLIFLFCVLKRDALATIGTSHLLPGGRTKLPEHRTASLLELTSFEIGALLAVEAANVAEQTCDENDRPSPWFSRISSWPSFTNQLSARHPFRLRAASITLSEESEMLRQYLLLTETVTPKDACDVAEDLLQKDPVVAEPFIVGALAMICNGRFSEAARLADYGVFRAAQIGTAWDKRLEMVQWQHLARTVLKRATTGRDTMDWRRIMDGLDGG
jgi:hypothetical protein